MEQQQTPGKGTNRKKWPRIVAAAIILYLIIVIGIVAFAIGQFHSAGTTATIGQDGSKGAFTKTEEVFIYKGTTLLGSQPYRTVVVHAGKRAHIALPEGKYAYFLGRQIGSPSTTCTMGYGIIAVTSSGTDVTWYPPFCH